MKPLTIHGRRAITGYLFLAPFLLFFLVFIIVPLIGGFGLGFVEWELVSGRAPSFVGLQNYREAFGSGYFWKAMLATFKFVILIVPSTVVIALAMALALHAIPTRRQELYRAVFFLPTMVSISAASLIWRWFYTTEFGLLNSLLQPFGVKVNWLNTPNMALVSIVVMTLWWTIGGPIVIFAAGLKELPRDYFEAAAIDGASRFAILRYVTLPLLKPIIIFVAIINTIGSFQVFGQTFMITRGGPELSTRVMVQYIYETAFSNYRMGYGASISWLLFVVILFFVAIHYRFTRETP